MTNEEQKKIIQNYITAYNSFDIDGMVALAHPKVVFKNIAGGKVTAEASGADQYRELAIQSKALFSSRQQEATNLKLGNSGRRSSERHECRRETSTQRAV
jgi:hypothetical protein